MSTYRSCPLTTATLLLGLMTATVSGCTTPQTAETETAMSATAVAFPDPQSAWREGGSYPNLDNLRTLHEGMDKDQVYDLVGPPHFDEGMFGEREWNYLFHLPDGRGGYRLCQYQLHFDDAMRVDGRYWQNGACAQLLAPEATPAMDVTLDVDTLFDLDSAELSSRGQQRIAELAVQIRERVRHPRLMVIGHTDRLGSEQYNQTLSDRRAMAVRRALIDQGIDSQAISSWGVGESEPVKSCSDSAPRETQAACLAPNRRVEIRVVGEAIRAAGQGGR